MVSKELWVQYLMINFTVKDVVSKMKLPPQFLTRMEKRLGDEFEAFLQSYSMPRAAGIRANSLKIDAAELKNYLPFLEAGVPWCRDGFYYDEEQVRPAKHPYYYAGLYYIQEPSAMLPASLLDVSPGDKVLDLCAAPGGKSVQLAAKLAGDGLLVVNDISLPRAKVLLKNIERYGVVNAVVLNENPERLSDVFKGFFNKILVDAPCSGEGMFHKEPDMAKEWSEQEVAKYCEWQAAILKYIPDMLSPGGEVVYSTCTFSSEENEDQIDSFLSANTNFAIAESRRLLPHKVRGEGHFAARLINTCKPIETNCQPKKNQLPKSSLQSIEEFSKQVWGCDEKWREWLPSGGTIVERSGHVLWESICLPSLRGLKVLRSGWLLGMIERGRFRPSQAFALGMSLEAAQAAVQRYDLSARNEYDKYSAIRYLRGETIQQEDKQWPKGWHLITLEGFPIGWGKGPGHYLKNEYPPGWRWQD